VLVGYVKGGDNAWLRPPNLDVDAVADQWGGVDPQIEKAVTIVGLPAVDVHAWRYEAGRHTLDLRGDGSFVILGVIPADAPLTKRDAGRASGE
jgi:hypothetical protein